MGRSEGFTVLEVLLVVALLGLLGMIALGAGSEILARLEVEAATRRVLVGLERGRIAAERQGRPCALSLDVGGWGPPSAGDLPACAGVPLAMGEGLSPQGGLRLEHNLPAAVRFSSNGLVLDGGTVLLTHRATALSRCVVVSLPLGVTRVGLLQGDGICRPDPNL